MGGITKQSEFSRIKYNQAKMGSYYTELEHCRWISRFLEFPDDEVCCLEPAIGNAEAVLAVTGKEKEERKNVKIFGVELNGDTYGAVSGNPGVDFCLKADFLNDVVISQKAFSFVFMNPPYGKKGDGERYETAFLKKAVPYMAKEKIFVQPYIVDNLGRPPVIPSEGQMYLLAVSGAEQGIVGKEENKDIHLQRGYPESQKEVSMRRMKMAG